MRWTVDDMPDLAGKTAVVTGANSGLGLETAAALATKGAHVVMACRNQAKAKAAVDEITTRTPDASLEVIPLDLSRLDSVDAFASAFKAAHPKLDILANNAGVMFCPRGTTADGFEAHFGTNHLGHFALTGRLMDVIAATPGARVVTLSSEFAQFGKINLGDLNMERSFSRMRAYANSKLANQSFALELDRRLKKAGASAISVGAHPGYSATNLQSAGLSEGEPDLWARANTGFMVFTNAAVAQSAAMGALPTLRGATAPDVEGGDYYGPRGPFNLRGYPGRCRKLPRAKDEATAAALWDKSQEMTGVAYL